ncbi:MAG: phosphonate ABC transporter ATP-binding protein [Anaerolineae bacterium]
MASPTLSPPVFELDHVSVHFRSTTALSDVSLIIHEGERVALVGPSGAGKSTLIQLLNGTIAPTQGTVRAFGRELNHLSGRERRRLQRSIGTIYQQFQLVDQLAVIHNVNAGHLGQWPFWKAALSLIRPLEVDRARWALSEVGIPEKIYARTDQLSGGQQQRVALARVLIQDPAVILADEPISHLDPERGREIMDLIRNLCDRSGKTLVITLHRVDFARSHCRRIIGLRHGRVAFDLPADEVTADHVRQLYQLDEADSS